MLLLLLSWLRARLGLPRRVSLRRRRGLPRPRAGGERGDFLFEVDELASAGHARQQLVARDLVPGIGARGAAAVEQREAVADDIGMVDVVGDEDDADVSGARLRDQFQYHRSLVHAER